MLSCFARSQTTFLQVVSLFQAPPRLAVGENWFIEFWEGNGSEMKTQHLATELGERLALLHKIPAGWFDKWRVKLKDHHPKLKGCPDGSPMWWVASRVKMIQGTLASKPEGWCEAYSACVQPLSPAAGAIVTTHGDCHRGNLVLTDAGIKFIDLEFSVSEDCGVHRLCA